MTPASLASEAVKAAGLGLASSRPQAFLTLAFALRFELPYLLLRVLQPVLDLRFDLVTDLAKLL